ncbi:unnamed protein product, partial [Meganyctiphanes norvegica]
MENVISIAAAENTWSDDGTEVAEPSEPDAASLAVGVVVEGARKGVVALCASVAHIIRERNRLEERIKDLERQISIGNTVRTTSSTRCTLMNQVSSSTKSRSLPESPSALRQRCGSAPPAYINPNTPVTTGNMSMRLPHTERKKYITQGVRDFESNSFLKNDRNRNYCACNESKRRKIINDSENHECAIIDKPCQNHKSCSKVETYRRSKNYKISSSKKNTMNSNKEASMCIEKNVESSPGSDTSYERNISINGHCAGLRASRSYSGSHGISPQLLLTPDYGYGKNHDNFQKDSKCWSTRSLNLGVNFPRGSFMRRKYSTISLRRVKRNVSSKERSCSSGGTVTSSSTSSRGSSFDLGSRRSSDLVNVVSCRRGSQLGIFPSQQQHIDCVNCSNRSTVSGSGSSRSCIVTVAEVHNEPEITHLSNNNTEREAVKLLARTLTTFLREQNETQELDEISSPTSKYMNNTIYDSSLNCSKQSTTSTSLCSSKMPSCLNKNDSSVTYPISEFDDTKNQDCDVTFDVPSKQTASPLPRVSESFQCSPGSHSSVSENFESSSGQDTYDATENASFCNQ